MHPKSFGGIEALRVVVIAGQHGNPSLQWMVMMSDIQLMVQSKDSFIRSSIEQGLLCSESALLNGCGTNQANPILLR